MVKLIVHIGHGKTGSTSIQQSLLNAAPELERQKVRYLGLMLEHVMHPGGRKERWQTPTGSYLFFDRTAPETANAAILEILERELEFLEAQGFDRAIWSNEWLLTRSKSALPALHRLRERGFDVEIQCYVRRHDKWAQSAYAQWGMKHKSYEGPLRPFAEWLPSFGDRDFRFAPPIMIWDAVFGSGLKVFNFDRAGDVVQHFLAFNGIPGIPSVTENTTPDPPIVAAQAVFNSRSRGQVLPAAFDVVQRRLDRSDANRSVLPPIDRLVPSPEALERLVAERADDIGKVNAFLARTGEPPLSFDTPPRTPSHPTAWEMDQVILKLVYALIEDIGRLRGEIELLKSANHAREP